MSFDEKPQPEIVIIRRGGQSDDHGHHGGAWKIAYADFMTAMMALFLVMWLINATDAKTLAQVSTYFNPISLTDRTTTDRGVQDLQQGGTGKKADKQPAKSEQFDKQSDPKNEIGRAGDTDEGLFADPYDVLNKLAARAAKVPLPSSQGDVPQDQAGREDGGIAFRDPFDPEFRFNSKSEDDKSNEIRPKFEAAKEAGDGHAPEGKAPQDEKSGAQKPGALAFGEQIDKAEGEAGKQAVKQVEPAKSKDAKADDLDVPQAIKSEAAQIEAELRKTIQESGFANLPDISVQKTKEGVLISMTDQSNFEMFALSSAEPKPEMVVLMEKMGKILSGQPGRLVVRGYTDARPFRSKTYDNWRLSTARAHIAHYMLVRGGLDKERFEKIEGHADRDPKVPEDPNAAQNRRIEILLKPATA